MPGLSDRRSSVHAQRIARKTTETAWYPDLAFSNHPTCRDPARTRRRFSHGVDPHPGFESTGNFTHAFCPYAGANRNRHAIPGHPVSGTYADTGANRDSRDRFPLPHHTTGD